MLDSLTYNDVIAIVLFVPILATALGLGIIWITYKLDQDMFKDERDS